MKTMERIRIGRNINAVPMRQPKLTETWARNTDDKWFHETWQPPSTVDYVRSTKSNRASDYLLIWGLARDISRGAVLHIVHTVSGIPVADISTVPGSAPTAADAGGAATDVGKYLALRTSHSLVYVIMV